MNDIVEYGFAAALFSMAIMALVVAVSLALETINNYKNRKRNK